MWFLYVEGHGVREFDNNEADELHEAVIDELECHQADAITVIEGRDVTSDVINDTRKD